MNRQLTLVVGTLMWVMLYCSCNQQYYTYDNQTYNSEKTDYPEGSGCYAQCAIPDSTLQQYHPAIYEYTGQDYDQDYVEYREGQIVGIAEEASAKWVKKKADKNCLSSDPDDCLVWCLVESPTKYITRDMYIVTDTSLTTEWVIIDAIREKSLNAAKDIVEWRGVVCDQYRTLQFYVDLSHALIDNGYATDISTKFSNSLRTSLKKYQRDNLLPVGQLDCETMVSLQLDVHCDH